MSPLLLSIVIFLVVPNHPFNCCQTSCHAVPKSKQCFCEGSTHTSCTPPPSSHLGVAKPSPRKLNINTIVRLKIEGSLHRHMEMWAHCWHRPGNLTAPSCLPAIEKINQKQDTNAGKHNQRSHISKSVLSLACREKYS